MSIFFDQAGFSQATATEVNEVNDRDDLLGAGSHFRWHLRIRTADAQRFSLSSREVNADLHSRQLPGTIAGFREYLDELCPNLKNRAFRMRGSAFPTSPYQIVPVQFTRDLWFKPSQEAEGSDEISEREAAIYQKLINSSRGYARSHPKVTVEFEIKIFFLKAEQVVPEHKASR